MSCILEPWVTSTTPPLHPFSVEISWLLSRFLWLSKRYYCRTVCYNLVADVSPNKSPTLLQVRHSRNS